MSADLPIVEFPEMKDFEMWLEVQGPSSPGAWLKFAKKGSGMSTLSKQEAIDAALCHGWVDGQLKPLNEHYWLIRFTPRRPKSKWSLINRKRVDELIEAGRMTNAGLAEVSKAKEDGRWEAAYVSQGTATVPDDLMQALEDNLVAKTFFENLDAGNRYAILYRLATCSNQALRQKNLAKYVGMLERGEVFHEKSAKKK